MPHHGTVVSIKGLFSKLPVRFQQISEREELTEIRKYIELLALIRPEIRFRVFHSIKNKCILEIMPCSGPAEMFNQLFLADNVLLSHCQLGLVDFSYRKRYQICGFFCERGSNGPNLQFLGM